MSVRYILVGGLDYIAADGGKALCEAMIAGHQEPVHILSEPPETWEEKFERKAKQFLQRNLGDRMTCELADPAIFAEQLARAQVLYLHGGNEKLLGAQLDRFRDLASRMFDGKTVVGSSAGADYLSAVYWTCDERSVGRGKGILQLAFMPHYNSAYGHDDPRGPIDWQKAKAELAAAAGHLPVHCLGEGEFIDLGIA